MIKAISHNIKQSLKKIDFIRLKDKSMFFQSKRSSIKSSDLDYDNMIEGKTVSVKDG